MKHMSAFVLTIATLFAAGDAARGDEDQPWTVGTPIVTWYAGPAMSEATAAQMAEAGFNVVWCTEQDLDLVHKHGLRGMLGHGLIQPYTVLDDPQQRAQLDAMIERVKDHPAMYSYYLIDEPSAVQFPALAKLVAYLKERDPDSLAYINLFPNYASNEQLGNQGDMVTAYREHLQQYMEQVKPDLVSYDHYQFKADGDGVLYFLNLEMIRQAAQEANVPFLNIVQACSWSPDMRVPNADETRYLVYTTLGYGAQGISYFVYSEPGFTGGIANADGNPTRIFDTLKTLNREFVGIASELQPLRSLAIYHTTMTEAGCHPLPEEAPFRVDDAAAQHNQRGVMLGYFGANNQPTHVLVVNLDYRTEIAATLSGPGMLEVFDATRGEWSARGTGQVLVQLPPGGGKLVRSR